MRNAWLVLMIAALGCTDQTPGAPVVPNSVKDAGGSKPRGDGGISEAADPLAPTAMIVAPSPASNPDKDEVLVEPMVTVVCKVKKSTQRNSRDVDNASVRIEAVSLVDDKKMVMGLVKPGSGRDEFEAEILLDEFPNGGVRFTCEVDDVSEPARTGEDAVDTLLDLGPNVEILEPEDKSRHALKDPVTVKFEVTPAPIANNDEGAEISAIELRILDQPFEFEEDPMIAGLFTASIDFDDRTRFSMAPTSADIVVVANNSRKPTAVQRRAEVKVNLDADGPAITVMSPGNRSIVRGQIQLVVKITDASGVANDTVIGRINGAAFILDPMDWEINGDTYVAEFDTRAPIFTDLTELTINITASDMVGNERTVDHTLRLDNVAPLVSLDPPVIREARSEGGKTVCSHPFDPLGADATSDLQTVARASMYRALVFERTNMIEGQPVFYVAGVDEGSMRLYARKKDDIPLLIDTDGDGQCDDINSEGLDEKDRPVVTTLSPMDVRGDAYYWSMTNFESAEHTAGGCNKGTMIEPPGAFCPATAMFRVIPQPLDGKPRAIYGIAPVNGMTGACQGNSWSLEPILREGWVCLAATVNDNIGNRGISRPIRVCIDDGEVPAPSCLDQSADPPPSCVDNCTLPDDLPMDYTQTVMP